VKLAAGSGGCNPDGRHSAFSSLLERLDRGTVDRLSISGCEEAIEANEVRRSHNDAAIQPPDSPADEPPVPVVLLDPATDN